MGVWQEMIALLDAESMRIDVEGEKGKSHGMIGCALISRPNSYDHKRSVQEDAVAAENRTEPLRVWGCLIRRFDGTAIRLHPQRNTHLVESYSAAGPPEQVVSPARGYGQSDGRGAFQKYTNLQTRGCLKLDPRKGAGLTPHKKTN